MENTHKLPLFFCCKLSSCQVLQVLTAHVSSNLRNDWPNNNNNSTAPVCDWAVVFGRQRMDHGRSSVVCIVFLIRH
jgi:hypothetical protein